MRILFILLILLSSCKTSKKVQVSELEKIKTEINTKIDSLSTRFKEIQQTKELAYKIDSTNTDFEITFKDNEVGQIDLTTPQGNFSAVKSGNGNVTIKGNSKVLKTDKIQSNKIQSFEKFNQETQTTQKQEIKRQSEKKTKEVKPNPISLILSYVPWWMYVLMVLGLLISIFWKTLKSYLRI